MFIVNESKAWPPMFDDARKAEDKGDRINRLRQYLLTEKMGSAFAEPYELASLVQAAIAKHLDDNKPLPVTIAATDGSRPNHLGHRKRRLSLSGPDALHAQVCAGILRSGSLKSTKFSTECADRKAGSSSSAAVPATGKSSLRRCRRASEARRDRPAGHWELRMQARGAEPGQSSFRCAHASAAARRLNGLGSDPFETGQRLAFRARHSHRTPENDHLVRMSADSLVLFLDQMEELFTAQTKDARGTIYLCAVQSRESDNLPGYRDDSQRFFTPLSRA